MRLAALLVETERNAPCRAVYQAAGWRHRGDRWQAPKEIVVPDHVRILEE